MKNVGLGPNVINAFNTSRAIRLETLDGEPMANYINRSCLKNYEEPLINEMLQRIHVAKTCKQGLAQLKKQAKDEENAWVQRAKGRRR